LVLGGLSICRTFSAQDPRPGVENIDLLDTGKADIAFVQGGVSTKATGSAPVYTSQLRYLSLVTSAALHSALKTF